MYLGYKNHLRVDHSANEFSSRSVRGNYVNGIEGFWGYAETRPARLRGMHSNTFPSTSRSASFAPTTAVRTFTCAPKTLS